MQSDMSLSNDTFTATISNQDAILRDLTFQIKVIPLIRRQEAFSVTESKMPLTQKHLDASHLAGEKSRSILIRSDPFWYILIHFDPFWSILIHSDPFCRPDQQQPHVLSNWDTRSRKNNAYRTHFQRFRFRHGQKKRQRSRSLAVYARGRQKWRHLFRHSWRQGN